MEAVQHIPIEDRDAFKYALGATLIKNHAHWRSFETVFEVYFSLRGPEYKIAEGDGDTDIDELWREMQEAQQQGEGQGQGGMDWDDARRDRPDADAGADERRPGDDARDGQAGRAALRRDGAGSPRRRHVLPVSHAAQPRPRQHAREDDGSLAPGGVRRSDLTRGAVGEGGVRGPHREVQGRDRSRDPAPTRRRPRRRGDGQDTAQAAPRRRRVHARVTRRDGGAQEVALPAHPQARRPTRPQAQARSQGSARLPQHGAPFAELRRRARRTEVQVPASRPSRS